jgi:hypothetical protein
MPADAHSRVRRLQAENGDLRRELGRAEARAELAELRITQLLDDLHRAFAQSAGGVEALADAAQRLEGTERFLKAQNDAVRLQATTGADGLRRVVGQLRDQVCQLQIENDQYRRALAAHPARNDNARSTEVLLQAVLRSRERPFALTAVIRCGDFLSVGKIPFFWGRLHSQRCAGDHAGPRGAGHDIAFLACRMSGGPRWRRRVFPSTSGMRASEGQGTAPSLQRHSRVLCRGGLSHCRTVPVWGYEPEPQICWKFFRFNGFDTWTSVPNPRRQVACQFADYSSFVPVVMLERLTTPELLVLSPT